MQALLVQPAIAADALSIHGLRAATEDWLASQGIEQWGRGQVTITDIRQQIADGQWHIVRAGDGLVGALRLLWSNELVWQHENGYAAYVHGVMVPRSEAGRGIGAAVMRWAEEQARAVGAPAVRLDCVESNHTLRAYYLSQGFEEVGRRDFHGPWHSVVLFEKRLI